MINWLKAKFFLMLVTVIWGSFIVLFSPFMAMTRVYDWLVNHKVKWFISFMLIGDLATNFVLGGHHRTYISSHLGHLKLSGSKGGTVAANFVDWLFYIGKGEVDHCINAMKPTDVYNFSARRALLGTATYFVSLYLIYTGIRAA